MKYIKSICYSGFRENQHPGWGVYPSYEEIREDLHILVRDGYRQIRMYDPNVHAIRALEIIKEDKLPLKVMLGLGLVARNTTNMLVGGCQSRNTNWIKIFRKTKQS